MPERLDRVTVAVPMGTHAISRAACETLVAKLEQQQTEAWLARHWPELTRESTAAAIRVRFEGVRASRPVELSAGEKRLLCVLLTYWPMTHEGVGDDTRTELLSLLAALERGDPKPYIVEWWEEGDDNPARGVSSNWRWRWEQWGERPRYTDHLHCLFCDTRFSDRSDVDYDLAEGWCGVDEDDYQRWVCAGCFEKLRERFGWKAESPR